MSRLVAFFCVTTLAAMARADEMPPAWGFEIKGGPYQPQVGTDDERTYFEAIYASEPDEALFEHRPLLWSLETDWYFVRDIGLLGPLVRVGYWSIVAPNRVCGPQEARVDCTVDDVLNDRSSDGNDDTRLTAFPLSVGVVYRMDLLKRTRGIPLVPFAKASVDYYFWRNTVRGEVSRRDDGLRGAGGTLGAQASAGVAFNLDWIEPGAASRARASTGLADSYLFGEYSQLWADGLGDDKRLDFSGWVVQVGLALDFD